MATKREQLTDASRQLMQKTWSQWGKVDEDVLTHLVNPSLMGGPRWPAMRQAYWIARKPGQLLVASDGLSLPFDDQDPPKVNGMQLEVFGTSNDTKTPPQNQVVFKAVWALAQVCAKADVADRIDEMAVISTELNVEVPAEHRKTFINEHGRIGALIGLEVDPLPDEVKGPLSRILVVSLTLLTVAELNFVLVGGADARADLADMLEEAGLGGSCDLNRKSLV